MNWGWSGVTRYRLTQVKRTNDRYIVCQHSNGFVGSPWSRNKPTVLTEHNTVLPNKRMGGRVTMVAL